MYLTSGVRVEEQEGPGESPRCSEPPSVYRVNPFLDLSDKHGGEGRSSSVESRHLTWVYVRLGGDWDFVIT